LSDLLNQYHLFYKNVEFIDKKVTYFKLNYFFTVLYSSTLGS